MIQPKQLTSAAQHGKTRIWNSKLVEEVRQKVINGEEIVGGNPFHEGDIDFRAGDIIYEYSEEELKEIAKCATDIVYFANTYCVSMTDDGVQKIKLRPYQEKALRSYQDNRWIVFLASRQIGKCFSRQVKIKVLEKTTNQEFVFPLYHLYYLFDYPKSFLGYFKLFLYKIETFLTEGKIYNTRKLKKILNDPKKS